MKTKFLIINAIIFSIILFAQEQKKVLFVGNSYTSFNNLPLLVSNMATSTGNQLIYDSNTPGGYRLMNHATNATTLNKINANDWDFVALQAQSQETSWEQSQMQNELYPYANTLSNLIRTNDTCSQPLFYMTWGRENGDSQNCNYLSWVCTYEGMDDAIRSTYIYMAEQNNAEIAPAGAVWRYLRTHYPQIDLYANDGSHPSIYGSYAVACAFYTIIFKKDPTLITWNSTLTENEANIIKTATKTVVFDALDSWDKTAYFNESITDNTVDFTYGELTANNYQWDFGDATTSSLQNPSHTYDTIGDFNVTLTITHCGRTHIFTKTIHISTLNVNDNQLEDKTILVYPNPAKNILNIKGLKNTKNTIVIYNTLGQKIKQFENIADKISISDLEKGIYFISILDEENDITQQIIRE